MAYVAGRAEIEEYLSKVSGAQAEWVDVLATAKLSMAAVDKFVQRMRMDADSPLRRAEGSKLAEEVVRLNGVFGDLSADPKGNGRPRVRLSAVMGPQEMSRLDQLVGGFCQPVYKTHMRFGNNGHVVMNAVRRCTFAYLVTKVPVGSRVLEVGPDVRNWITDSSVKPWEQKGGKYTGARPVLGMRDVVRTDWRGVAARIIDRDYEGTTDIVRERVAKLRNDYDNVFPGKRVQVVEGNFDCIISGDSNYDIAFGDMPLVMERVGAKAWFGSMLRVKGLTTVTRMESGELPLMGVNYRVDWNNSGRIDFRHPRCNAFGYSHKVSELVKYEEMNGHVWTSSDANYVYAKGPETNDEILFFSVVRVAKALYLRQPSFVENPRAGMLRVSSIWAVGGWSDGIPTKFEPVVFYVDRLVFMKVVEKRRALDVRGDLATTTVLVRSSNVRMWFNNAPVGATHRIAPNLIEASAVAIEAFVSQERIRGDMVYSRGMKEYEISMSRGSWAYRMLSSVIDLRAAVGSITGPVTRTWESVRETLADAALSTISSVSISMTVVPDHLRGKCVGEPERICVLKTGATRDTSGSRQEWVAGACPEGEGNSKGSENVSRDEDNVSDSGLGSDISGSTKETWSEPETVEVTEDSVIRGWRDSRNEDMVERRAMEESVFIKQYLYDAVRAEVRIDAGGLHAAGVFTDTEILRRCTTRTQHTLVRFQGGRHVESRGYKAASFSAIYDPKSSKFYRVTQRGAVAVAGVNAGWYYTNNHMKVWNHEDLIASVSHILDYGIVRPHRKQFQVTLGVPGAGKTFSMMKKLAEDYSATGVQFLVVAVTNKAVLSAIAEGVSFGLDEKMLMGRVRTLDSYLISRKSPADLLCIDEFSMAHSGDLDAVVSMSGASVIRLYGDGRQIPYDPFTAELDMKFGALADTVPSGKISFLEESHRLPASACAAWLDLYPKIYPCKCHTDEQKERAKMEFVKISDVSDVRKDDKIRFHAYTRAELDDLADSFHVTDRDFEKKKKNSGLASVHEDQGSTHRKVVSVRLRADYDRNASKFNPSLYNRLNYVLTDQTRHTHGYVYMSTSSEIDVVRRRIKLSESNYRLKLVSEKAGMGMTTVSDMLANRFSLPIQDGSSERV